MFHCFCVYISQCDSASAIAFLCVYQHPSLTYMSIFVYMYTFQLKFALMSFISISYTFLSNFSVRNGLNPLVPHPLVRPSSNPSISSFFFIPTFSFSLMSFSYKFLWGIFTEFLFFVLQILTFPSAYLYVPSCPPCRLFLSVSPFPSIFLVSCLFRISCLVL